MNSRYGNKILALIVFVIGIWSSLPIQAAVREYWVAAEKMSWDYAPSGQNLINPDAGLGVWGKSLKYTKYRYIGYTDGSYTIPLQQAEWMGILGPQLRGAAWDTIIVHFLNKTDRPLSMHPHGMHYSKNEEGADGVSAGASVPPNGSNIYRWAADEAAGPGPSDPSTIVWLYHSHVMVGEEINLGLIGTLVITRKGMENSASNPFPRDVDHEFISLFMSSTKKTMRKAG